MEAIKEAPRKPWEERRGQVKVAGGCGCSCISTWDSMGEQDGSSREGQPSKGVQYIGGVMTIHSDTGSQFEGS